MFKYLFIFFIICNVYSASAQIFSGDNFFPNYEDSLPKGRAVTHKDYDVWNNFDQQLISNDGKIVVYTINPQEGDGNLYIQHFNGKPIKRISRGYNAAITNDSKFIIFKIKPYFKDTREAKIKKKSPAEMPKDSLAVYDIVNDSVVIIPRVKSYKLPEKGFGWLAYLLEKTETTKSIPKTENKLDSLGQINQLIKQADSMRKISDSLLAKAKLAKDKGLVVLEKPKKDPKIDAPQKPATEPIEEGTQLVLVNLLKADTLKFNLVDDYLFDKNANKLLVKTTRKNDDSLIQASIILTDLNSKKIDTIFKKFNDAKNFTISNDGLQVAFVAEKDSAVKALQKFYKLWYYKSGDKEANLLIDKNNKSIPEQHTISPDYANKFSGDGSKLYFGYSPIRKPKDTTLVDFETARLDIWHHNDDFLQPQQLVNAQNEIKRSYLSVYDVNNGKFLLVGSDTAEIVRTSNEGNPNIVLTASNKGYRKPIQWQGFAHYNYTLVDLEKNTRKRIATNTRDQYLLSPKAKYVYWYDYALNNWFTLNTKTFQKNNLTKNIKVSWVDEKNDVPDLPNEYGVMSWSENDEKIFIYDRYDIWQLDPEGKQNPINLTQMRKRKTVVRKVLSDKDEEFLNTEFPYAFYYFDENNKNANFAYVKINELLQYNFQGKAYSFSRFQRSIDDKTKLIFTNENSTTPPQINAQDFLKNSGEIILGKTNTQQANYNWYTNSLEKWKMFDGKMSEGILYKPQNFDSTKKYPIIFYFYERNSNTLNNYKQLAPSASTINIPYFTSNGYLVFDPDIYYKTGNPGESAYNSVVSAAKHLAKKYKFIDSTKMAIQGQSWGGYQVAYLVTRTNIFAAAGSGAPVSNMTSAYGGIRWSTGLSRQFQYEKSQSRLGATLWQNRDLYIKNSPLFFADKIKTPILIMHNDKDGAVPWYQGIEFFTALRRLNKPVWMLQYNDEDHNLVERRNRKDLSVRLAQFFDYYLKAKPQPKWMEKGVPAIYKGIEWGLE